APSGQTKSCAAAAEAFADANEMPIVRLEAANLMDARCTEADALLPLLEAQAKQLGEPASRAQWHVPARALEALARVAPQIAAGLLSGGATHTAWHVRAAAARAAASVKDEAALAKLANDSEANVRTE